jgi:hypothetical protein
MKTYQKDDMILGNFNHTRNNLNDSQGKNFAIRIFKLFNGEHQITDRDQNNKLLWDIPDIKIHFPNKNPIFVEVELKANHLWKFIQQGVDIPARKIKYTINTNNQGIFFIGKKDQTECLLIPFKYVHMAHTDCKDQFMGSKTIPNSPKFKMPPHQCHRIRKICNQDEEEGLNVEDFIRIPYKYTSHIVYKNNQITIVN